MTQIKLELIIFGDLLNPDILSKIIGKSPTDVWVKGDVVPKRKNGLVRKETCWKYSFGFIQTIDFERIYNMFIEFINPNLELLIQYIGEKKLETKIDIIIEIINMEKPVLCIEKKFMDIILKMNGEIDIDLYILEE